MRQPVVVSCWNALVRPNPAAKVSIASTADEAAVGRVEPPDICGLLFICSYAAMAEEWLATRGLAYVPNNSVQFCDTNTKEGFQ